MTIEELLAFERAWANLPQTDGRKAQQVRDRWGISETAYYRQLNAVLDTREALEADAVTTRQLQRRRGRHTQSRRAG